MFCYRRVLRHPVTTLLIISMYLIRKYFLGGKTRHLFLSISAWGVIVLTRTAFHPLWLLSGIALLTMLRKGDIKRILLCSALPVTIVTILMLKNGVMFNFFGLTSWYGMNLYKMTLSIPRDKLESLVESDAISRLALIPPFQDPDQYRNFADFDSATGIKVLDQRYRSTSYPNYNHRAYVSISKQYFAIAKDLIVKYPQYYLLSVGKAVYRFLMPTSDKIIFPGQNRQKIKGWIDMYESYLLGGFLSSLWQTRYINRYGQSRTVHFNLLYLYIPFVYLGMIWFLLKGIKNTDLDRNDKATLHMICFQVLYVTSICNLVEYGENMRFRFIIIPYIYIGFALLLKSFIKKRVS